MDVNGKKEQIIVFISDDRHWPSTIASQYISIRVGQRMSNDELTQCISDMI